ncbi:MAG: CorA family divalent cation transporter [Gemmatimonadota bacterium]
MTRESVAFRMAGLKWVDVVDPTPAEVERLVKEYGLHHEAVEDCLDPEHLPKFEKQDGVTFLIVRAWDQTSDPRGDSVQALTRKVALFVGHDFLVTIHRKPEGYLHRLFEEAHGAGNEGPIPELVFKILDAAVMTYETPLQRLEDALDKWHDALFSRSGPPPALDELAIFKRQIALYKRMLQATILVFQRFAPVGERVNPACQSLIEDTQSMHAWADEQLDEANNLLQLQFALATHRTNDVVKVLTIFSAFFMPLTFLVGIYGMNFRHMPELEWQFGYFWSLGLMGVTALGIWLWFRRKGWL